MEGKLVFLEQISFMEVVNTIFKKLKKFNKHGCFGKNTNNPLEAIKKYYRCNPDKISKKIEKYKKLSSIVYITVHNKEITILTSLEKYFQKKCIKYNSLIHSVSKIVLKSIIENKINYKKLGILDIKPKILKLINNYNKKKKLENDNFTNYKYEIFGK